MTIPPLANAGSGIRVGRRRDDPGRTYCAVVDKASCRPFGKCGIQGERGRSSVVERQLPKLNMRFDSRRPLQYLQIRPRGMARWNVPNAHTAEVVCR